MVEYEISKEDKMVACVEGMKLISRYLEHDDIMKQRHTQDFLMSLATAIEKLIDTAEVDNVQLSFKERAAMVALNVSLQENPAAIIGDILKEIEEAKKS